MGIGITLVEKHGLLQAVEVGCAVWAALEMSFDFTALVRVEVHVKFGLNVASDLAAPR